MLHTLYRHINAPRIRRFIESPIFVVGNVRSGTTALRNALMQHPSILMADRDAPSLHLTGRLCGEYLAPSRREYLWSSCALSQEQFRRRMREFAFAAVWGPWRRFSLNPLHRRRKDSLWRLGGGVRRWGAKAFPESYDIDGISWLMPRALCVYIVRNGIEVVHSMGRFPSFSHMSMRQRCTIWADRVHAYRFLMDRDDALCIRHEKFVHDPHEVLQPVWKAAGLSPHPAPGEYAARHIVHPLQSEETHEGPVKEALTDRNRVWEEWSPQQRQVFRDVCAEPMQSLGYTIPGN